MPVLAQAPSGVPVELVATRQPLTAAPGATCSVEVVRLWVTPAAADPAVKTSGSAKSATSTLCSDSYGRQA